MDDIKCSETLVLRRVETLEMTGSTGWTTDLTGP
jgi:hypothetical protein